MPDFRPRPSPSVRQAHLRRGRHHAAARRRWVGVSLVLLLLAVGVGSDRLFAARSAEGVGSVVVPSRRLELRALGRVVARVDAVAARAQDGPALKRWRREVLRRLPAELRRRARGVTVTYRLDRRSALRRALAAGRRGGVVNVPAQAIESRVTAPVEGQKLRNNCETAALEILLATGGVRVDQLRLQDQIVKSGPLDPRETARGRVWGDPERGYVGRADGGGAAGGFGVYQGPVADLARAHGQRLEDLTGDPVEAVYDRVLEGQAVMTWVGLSDGPFGQWRSPQGEPVRVNFGEHTVVLVGITRGGRLRVVNPLRGTREVWSQDEFELMWNRLGRRALST